jgi:hypothetical protein
MYKNRNYTWKNVRILGFTNLQLRTLTYMQQSMLASSKYWASLSLGSRLSFGASKLEVQTFVQTWFGFESWNQISSWNWNVNLDQAIVPIGTNTNF